MTKWNWGSLILILLLAAGSLFYIFLSSQNAGLREVRVAAGPKSDDAYAVLVEIAEVVERHNPSIKLKLIETPDSSENVVMLQNGDADLAAIRSDSPSFITARLVAILYRDYYLLIARAETNIRSVTDLAGKRIAVPPDGTSGQRNFWTIADHYDVQVQSLRWKAVPDHEAIALMHNGTIDAMFVVGSSRDAGILKMVGDDQRAGHAPRFRFIPIDQASAMVLKRPFLSDGLLVKGAFFGNPPLPLRDIHTLSVLRYLIASNTADEDLVAEITSIIFEQRLDLVVRNPLAAQITPPELSDGPALPLHPGAARYFSRNEPSFLQENAEPIALGVTVLAMMFSGLIALRSRILANRKNRADHYNHDLLAIGRRARRADHFDQIEACRDDLSGVLERMVLDLDTDAVSEDGFQSFALTYRAVRDVIADASIKLADKKA